MNNQYDSEQNTPAMDGTDRARCLNAGERRNKIAYRLLGLLLAVMVMACSELADEEDSLLPDNQIHPTTAMTWPEWVAYETPKRQALETPYDFQSYHLSKGSPNYSQWRAQDMLPAEVLGHEHRDLCAAKDITQTQRSALRSSGYLLSGPFYDINQLLALAEQGYPEAQGTLGAFCDADMEQRVFRYDKDKDERAPYDDAAEIIILSKEKRKVLTQDALYWAQRGAASGNAIAQFALAQCMDTIYLRNDDQSEFRQAARKTDQPQDKIKIDAFWFDKIAYWRTQALQNGLLNQALLEQIHESSMTASQPRKIIEEYKWGRLWEIQVHFRKLFARYDDAEGEGESRYDRWGTSDLKQHLDSKALAQAEKEVGEWLRAHPEVWHNIYHHSYAQDFDIAGARFLCPGEQGDDMATSKDKTHHAAFDFVRLNKELAQYQLKIVVPKPPASLETSPDFN